MDRNQWERFERIYEHAESAGDRVPWDRGAAHRHLVEWAEREQIDGRGQRAVVVGSGLGDDAEFVAGLGFTTTGFDIAPAAIRMARTRFPDSGVTYLVADLFALPAAFAQAFDLVVENQTAQALPADVRPEAIAAIASLVAPGGSLLFLANRAVPGQTADGPPYSLGQEELDRLMDEGLEPVTIEQLSTSGQPRWRAVYRRPAG